MGFALLVTAPSAHAQDRDTEQVIPPVEDELRRHLRKLQRWSVSQLLRTEQKVDREQKRRANSSSNPQELALLADDEDEGVRFFVAANRHTPLGTRVSLANDPAATVRSGVALVIADDPLASPMVRQVVEDLGIRLARDKQVLVRLSLLANEMLPEAVYDSLALDPDYVVRQKLAKHRRAPSKRSWRSPRMPCRRCGPPPCATGTCLPAGCGA